MVIPGFQARVERQRERWRRSNLRNNSAAAIRKRLKRAILIDVLGALIRLGGSGRVLDVVDVSGHNELYVRLALEMLGRVGQVHIVYAANAMITEQGKIAWSIEAGRAAKRSARKAA